MALTLFCGFGLFVQIHQNLADLHGILHDQMLLVVGEIAAEFLDLIGQITVIADIRQPGHSLGPVNVAVEGHQVLVGHAVVILHMNGVEPGTDDVQILPVEVMSSQIGVAEVIAHAHMLRVTEGVHKIDQLVNAGAVDALHGLAGTVFKVVFQTDADAVFPGGGYVPAVVFQILFFGNRNVRPGGIHGAGVRYRPLHAQLGRGDDGAADQLLHGFDFFFVVLGEDVVIGQMGLAEQEGFYPIDESVEDDDLPF